MLNQQTRKMLTSAFLMQLIVILRQAGVQLAPSRMKRDYNQWADELTHPGFTGFRADRQLLPVSDASNHFTLLWAILNAQMDFSSSKRQNLASPATQGPL